MNAARRDQVPSILSLANGSRAAVTDADTDDATRARGGDMAAFERIYRRHHPRIRRLAAWMVGAEPADDLTPK